MSDHSERRSMNRGAQIMRNHKIQWGAVVAAMVALGGALAYYGCAPVVRSQLSGLVRQGNEAHRILSRNDKHQDNDLAKIMRRLGLEHDDDQIEDPPGLDMHSAAEAASGSAMASETP